MKKLFIQTETVSVSDLQGVCTKHVTLTGKLIAYTVEITLITI